MHDWPGKAGAAAKGEGQQQNWDHHSYLGLHRTSFEVVG